MPNPVPATAEGMPETRDPQAPHGQLTFHIEMDALRRMDMKQLHNFRDVMHMVGDVVMGCLNRSCFWQDDTNEYNEAGRMISDILDLFGNYEQAAVNVAKAATPTNPDDVEWRAWALINFEAAMTSELETINAITSQAVAAVIDAKRSAGRKGGAA